MLCFSSICPHPPIIIPEIGKENLKLVKKTTEAMNKLHKEFKKSKARSCYYYFAPWASLT